VAYRNGEEEHDGRGGEDRNGEERVPEGEKGRWIWRDTCLEN